MSSFRQGVDAPTLIHSKTALPSARRSDPSASVGARPTSAIVRATSSLWSCFARFHRACWHGVRPTEFQSPPGQIGTDVVSGDPQFGFTAGAFQLNVRYPKRLNQLLHSASAVPAFDRQHHVSDGHVHSPNSGPKVRLAWVQTSRVRRPKEAATRLATRLGEYGSISQSLRQSSTRRLVSVTPCPNVVFVSVVGTRQRRECAGLGQGSTTAQPVTVVTKEVRGVSCRSGRLSPI